MDLPRSSWRRLLTRGCSQVGMMRSGQGCLECQFIETINVASDLSLPDGSAGDAGLESYVSLLSRTMAGVAVRIASKNGSRLAKFRCLFAFYRAKRPTLPHVTWSITSVGGALSCAQVCGHMTIHQPLYRCVRRCVLRRYSTPWMERL